MEHPQSQQHAPRSIGVIGGGTAGYFAALAIKQRFPGIDVVLVESSAVPIIGVGEATTTLMLPFLHHQLGLDIAELFRAVRPSFKLGIKFKWGAPVDSSFNYPFGHAEPANAIAIDGEMTTQSLGSLLMAGDRGPVVRGPDGRLASLMPMVKFAYHLNNAPFVRYLASAAQRAGIGHMDATIDRIEQAPDGSIAALHATDGRALRFDLYIDATGFRSLLLGGALESKFLSYASSLFCDSAVVATVPQRGVVEPYTTAETMDAGWCWRIPIEGEDHRGYVYASSVIDQAQAVAEMRAKNPGMEEPAFVRFRSGRHADFWHKNVVAVGNAYGFVEPLESTALHMVIVETAYLLEGIAAMADPDAGRGYPAFASEAIGNQWDSLRWFLAIHYRFNGRLDTPFWRAARADVEITGLEDFIERYRREGPGVLKTASPYKAGSAFGFDGVIAMLLGQHVEAPPPVPTCSPNAWRERVARDQTIAQRAVPQAEALQLLSQRPDLLAQFVTGANSWCRSGHERVQVVRPA